MSCCNGWELLFWGNLPGESRLTGGLGSPGVCVHFGPAGTTALVSPPDLVLALSSLVTTG